MEYCVIKDVCIAFELCSWLLMEMGEKTAKKYLPTHTFRHCKARAEEIRKEMMFLQETRSIILVTNRPLSSWKEMKVDSYLMETLQERLIQNAQIISLA